MKNGVNPESPDLSYLGRNNAVLARLGAIKFTNEKDVKAFCDKYGLLWIIKGVDL